MFNKLYHYTRRDNATKQKYQKINKIIASEEIPTQDLKSSDSLMSRSSTRPLISDRSGSNDAITREHTI